MEHNSHLWAGASKSALDFVDRTQSRALKLIGDDMVASSIKNIFSKYRHFPRNIDSLGDRAKKRLFRQK